MNFILIALSVPVIIYLIYLFCTKPWVGFVLTLTINYVIMGAMRYGINSPLPVSVTIEIISIILLIVILSRRDVYVEDNKIPISLISIYGLWTLYCFIEIINDTCNLGIDIISWFREIRTFGLDPILFIVIYSLIICNKNDIEKYLVALGVILIMAGLKCFWQANWGFDSGEQSWLDAVGGRTHILHAGTLIRYFSFFTDAANYGSHTAMMSLIYGVHLIILPWRKWKLKLFYSIVTIACLYGMFMSGARAGMYVLIGTALAYVFLSRNWKMFSIALTGLILLVVFMVFTGRGNGISAIRRMRTAFNLESNESVQVRDTNKEAISKYLSEAPMGIGLGKSDSNIPEHNRYYVVAVTAPDSTLVYIWTRTGIIGVSIFCFVSLLILFRGTTIVWFKLKDPELRTTCATFIAGAAGWFAAGYANQIYFQYPNSFIIFGMLTIVFMAPYLEQKELEKKKQLAKISSDPTEN